MGVIPASSNIYKALKDLADHGRIVIFSGLPGTGKSLYINEFYDLAVSSGKRVTLVQWDQARKAFELPRVLARFPMGDGTVHNGVKLMAGEYIRRFVRTWHEEAGSDDLLLIEAPLVGHRFIELVEQTDDALLEEALTAENCKIVIPIPSREVRTKIEEARRQQVADDASQWIGAKPSVMKMLWENIYRIGLEFDMDIPAIEHPPYDPDVVRYVFSKICRHRNLVVLDIDEVFEVPEQSEEELHRHTSEMPTEQEVNEIFQYVTERFDNDQAMDQYVSGWYWQ